MSAPARQDGPAGAATDRGRTPATIATATATGTGTGTRHRR
ncbi:hypothetical protein ACFUIW_26775 [Streptomyces sp. NPDC057245]|nr:hypothetical protein [Streptomyces sp. A108]